ncbi:MAG: DNA-primase RepB domain-containing protein [Aliarcobacter sp.]|nr:DNA-primase RepB domain-containing protein [Aliarcobacter sp.]
MQEENIINFINSYFDSKDHFFITMINHQTNKTTNYHHNIHSFQRNLSRILYANNQNSIYFTINSFKDEENSFLNEHKYPSKVKGNVSKVKALVFDFDDPTTSKLNVANLIKTLNIKPTYILQTSPKKFQICFMLNDSVDSLNWEKVNKILAYYFDSDINVCSVEKLFRFPYFINRKNDYETNFYNFDFNLKYDFSIFEDFIKNTLDKKMIESKNRANKIKHNTPRIRKLIPRDSIVYEKKLETIEPRLIGKYTAILERNSDDASRTDILYIKDRRKKTDDFDMIFNEILLIRKSINKPLKRNLDEYYEERYSVFREE